MPIAKAMPTVRPTLVDVPIKSSTFGPGVATQSKMAA